MERSKLFASGFTLSHLLRAEAHLDVNIGHLLRWMDTHAAAHEPMHLDKFFSYTTFDNAGEALFSRSFSFIEQGRDVGGAIANTRSLKRYMGIAGYYVWVQRLLVANPVITSLNLLPMGHLFNMAMEALRQRKADPDARFDIVAQWLRTHQESPAQLSYRDVEAQPATSIAAGSDTLSCKPSLLPTNHLCSKVTCGLSNSSDLSLVVCRRSASICVLHDQTPGHMATRQE